MKAAFPRGRKRHLELAGILAFLPKMRIADFLATFYTACLMNIQMAVLCDAAVDYSGKLSVLGTFDTLYSAKLPAIHPQCSVALRIAFERSEEGLHQLRLNFVNEDGQPIMPAMDVPVDVAFSEDTTFISRNFIVNIQQLKLDQEGLYSVDVSLDGNQLSSIPLSVKQVESKEV